MTAAYTACGTRGAVSQPGPAARPRARPATHGGPEDDAEVKAQRLAVLLEDLLLALGARLPFGLQGRDRRSAARIALLPASPPPLPGPSAHRHGRSAPRCPFRLRPRGGDGGPRVGDWGRSRPQGAGRGCRGRHGACGVPEPRGCGAGARRERRRCPTAPSVGTRSSRGSGARPSAVLLRLFAAHGLSRTRRASTAPPPGGRDHGTVESVRSDLEDHRVQARPNHPALTNSPITSLRATSRRLLNTSRDGDSTTSMRSPSQCLTTLSVQKCFLIPNLNLQPPLVQPEAISPHPVTSEETSPALLQSPFRYLKGALRSPLIRHTLQAPSQPCCPSLDFQAPAPP